MVNLKIKGLKKIACESKTLGGYYSGEYLQVNYNRATGEAWTDYFYALGHNSWEEYHDSDIINCGNISEPATMASIREMIEDAVIKAKRFDRMYA